MRVARKSFSRGIRRVNLTEGAPIVFYMHPWEIDPDQPRMKVGRSTRWRHYGGLDRVATRLARLVKDFRFDTVANVLDLTPPSVAAGVAWPPDRQPVAVPR